MGGFSERVESGAVLGLEVGGGLVFGIVSDGRLGTEGTGGVRRFSTDGAAGIGLGFVNGAGSGSVGAGSVDSGCKLGGATFEARRMFGSDPLNTMMSVPSPCGIRIILPLS